MTKASRRRALQLGAVAVAGSLVGCLFGSGKEEPIDIEVRNGDTKNHEITVTVDGDFTANARTETLTSDETVTLEDMIPLLDYNHTFTIEVVLDGTLVSTTRHELQAIPPEEKSITLSIDRSGGVSLPISTVSPTPEP